MLGVRFADGGFAGSFRGTVDAERRDWIVLTIGRAAGPVENLVGRDVDESDLVVAAQLGEVPGTVRVNGVCGRLVALCIVHGRIGSSVHNCGGRQLGKKARKGLLVSNVRVRPASTDDRMSLNCALTR